VLRKWQGRSPWPAYKYRFRAGLLSSVAAFRRDFKKAFNTTPQKWLTERRLQPAYYHIKEKQRKPTDVYFEAGFENLSHFSHSLKTF